jgi:hypothetical protein
MLSQKSHSPVLLATVLLFGFLFLSNLVAGAYFGMRYPHDAPNRNYLLFERAVIWLLLGLWLATDAKRLGIAWVNRIGPFVYLIWPILVPYYLWQTRRFKGILPVLAFAAVFLITTAIGSVVYSLFIF